MEVKIDYPIERARESEESVAVKISWKAPRHELMAVTMNNHEESHITRGLCATTAASHGHHDKKKKESRTNLIIKINVKRMKNVHQFLLRDGWIISQHTKKLHWMLDFSHFFWYTSQRYLIVLVWLPMSEEGRRKRAEIYLHFISFFLGSAGSRIFHWRHQQWALWADGEMTHEMETWDPKKKKLTERAATQFTNWNLIHEVAQLLFNEPETQHFVRMF